MDVPSSLPAGSYSAKMDVVVGLQLGGRRSCMLRVGYWRSFAWRSPASRPRSRSRPDDAGALQVVLEGEERSAALTLFNRGSAAAATKWRCSISRWTRAAGSTRSPGERGVPGGDADGGAHADHAAAGGEPGLPDPAAEAAELPSGEYRAHLTFTRPRRGGDAVSGAPSRRIRSRCRPGPASRARDHPPRNASSASVLARFWRPREGRCPGSP